MTSGYISLFPLFGFIAKTPKIVGGKNKGFRPYTRICRELTKDIPKENGWYFWGRFDKNSNWECLYIGKSEKTKKKSGSLYYRINYELMTERIAFWAHIVGEKKAFQDHHDAFDGRFDKGARRAIRKAGAHFIIWISKSKASPKEVRNEEKALIRYWKPLCNKQIGNSVFTRKTKEICRLIKSKIDKILDVR